jgi:hypothetical protein
MARFGGVATIRRVATGSYDPAAGTIAETNTDTTVRGVLEDVNIREVNELVQAGDKRLIIAAADLTTAPTTVDKVLITAWCIRSSASRRSSRTTPRSPTR